MQELNDENTYSLLAWYLHVAVRRHLPFTVTDVGFIDTVLSLDTVFMMSELPFLTIFSTGGGLLLIMSKD